MRNILLLAEDIMGAKEYKVLHKRMVKRIWFMVGLNKYFLPIDRLTTVMDAHDKIGTLPKGYFYPELVKSPSISIEMRCFQQRKKYDMKKILDNVV